MLGFKRLSAGPLALLMVGGVCIAFAPIFVRLSETGPTPSAFWRMALALPFFLALSWRFDRPVPGTARQPLTAREKTTLVLCGLFFAGDLAFWHWSIMLTSVANSTLYPNLNPIYITLVGFFFMGKRFRPLFLMGLASALTGMVLLLGQSLQVGGDQLLGDLLGLATMVMYGSYFLTVEVLRRRFSTLTVMTVTVLVTGIILLPMAIFSGERFWPETLSGWLVLLGLAVVSQGMGQGLIAYALAHLPAAFTAVSLLIQPVVAALVAWMLFDEALGPLQGVGAVFILTGIVLARLGMIPKKKLMAVPAD